MTSKPIVAVLYTRPETVLDLSSTVTFAYNGLGDRYQQTTGGITTTTYSLDPSTSLRASLATGLTQVLADGTNTNLYGMGRIAQESAAGDDVFLGDALGSVRQLVAEDGTIALARRYEPYGEVSNSQGSGATSYGFTGEWTDATGLVHLRARYYAPGQGRFISKDMWERDYYKPLSLNGWNYVEANPINYIDPSGLWRWGITPSIYHSIIENYYEGLPTNPNKQLEFYIPGTPRHHPDMFNSLLGDVYEIEPWFLESNALPQVQGYVTDLLSAAGRGELTKKYLGIIPTDWNKTPFHIGIGKDWPGKFRMMMPGFPMVDLVADYVGNGTLLYWLEPNALAVVPFLSPNKHLVRPRNWIPGTLAPQPAYAISVSEACGYALVMTGGAIIVVTIVEDFATLGAGTFDDAVTVPAGILFINFGQRLGVLVPVSVP